jgi:hypothetical protein
MSRGPLGEWLVYFERRSPVLGTIPGEMDEKSTSGKMLA